MTLWNPLNVFSGRTHSAADGPSASFDPSRAGDPLGPRPTDPAIGLGGTQIAGPVSTGDPRRHPIGFAPPAERDAEPRFRTEISFRRHHEMPRAGAVPVSPGDGVQPAWRSQPEQVGSVDGDQVDVVEALPVQETVPFFKREISFRRKKSAGVEAAAAEETIHHADEEPVIEVEITNDVRDSTEEWEAPAVEGVAVSDEHEDQPEVAVEAVEPEAKVAEAVTSEDDADAGVPFYKRELSFRRKKPEAEVEAVDQPELVAQADAPVEVEPADVAEVAAKPELQAVAGEPAFADADAADHLVAEELQVDDP